MNTVTYLALANSAVWMGLAAYVVFLIVSGSALAKRRKQLEILEGDHE